MAFDNVFRSIRIIQDQGFAKFFYKSRDYIWRNLIGRRHRVRLHTVKNEIINNINWDYPPNPYAKIIIKATDINQYVEYDGLGSNTGLGKIKAGNWDLPKYIKSTDNQLACWYFKERFEHNKTQKNTKYYTFLMEKYKNKGEREIIDRLEEYDKLFYEIKNGGYKPRDIDAKNKKFRPKEPVSKQLEVYTVIGRDGTIYHLDGFHRLGIAQVLDLKIPSHVLCRHKEWQILRDDIANNGICRRHNKTILQHPDMKDVNFHSS